jgi:hypothetical protein
MAQCRECGQLAAHMPNTHSGVSDEKLAEIYNLMNVYIQPAICEGWGLPIPESKACGVPGMYQNYSAMEDHVENGGGIEIKIGRHYHEAETGSIRSLPDIDNMVEGMERFIFDDKFRIKKSAEALEVANSKHNWSLSVKGAERVLDSMEILDREKTWNRPPELKELNLKRPYPNMTDEQFVYWCYINILSRRPDDKGFNDWMGNLKNGTPREQIESFFRNEIIQHNSFELERYRKSLELRGEKMDMELEPHEQPLQGVLL